MGRDGKFVTLGWKQKQQCVEMETEVTRNGNNSVKRLKQQCEGMEAVICRDGDRNM